MHMEDMADEYELIRLLTECRTCKLWGHPVGCGILLPNCACRDEWNNRMDALNRP